MKQQYVGTSPKCLVLRTREVCFFLQVSRSTVHRMRRQRMLHHFQFVTGTVRYPKKEFIKFLEKRNAWLN